MRSGEEVGGHSRMGGTTSSGQAGQRQRGGQGWPSLGWGQQGLWAAPVLPGDVSGHRLHRWPRRPAGYL